jgi:hypothetical protein
LDVTTMMMTEFERDSFWQWLSALTQDEIGYLSLEVDRREARNFWMTEVTEGRVMAKLSDWGEEVGRYNSTRDKTKIYTVRRYIGDPTQAREQRIGQYGCDCPGWRFSKESPRVCVHVRAADEGPTRQRAERVVQLSDMLARSGLLATSTALQYRSILDNASLPQPRSRSAAPTIPALINGAVGKLLTELENSGLCVPVDTSNEAKPGKTRLITLD